MQSLPLVASLLIAALVGGPLLRALRDHGLLRENYRGAAVPFPIGVLIPVAAMLALIPLALLQELAGADIFTAAAYPAVTYVIGVALSLGALDVHGFWTVGLFLGPVLVLLPLDLRERGMLGDCGSNAIGALAGVWLIATLDTTGQAIAVAAMALITAYGEFRSISRLIDRTPGLRHLDSLGRTTHA